MHDDLRSAPLTFPSLPVGPRETPPDLTRLLYKGGAQMRADKVQHAIQEGLLGTLQIDRQALVLALHEAIDGKLAGGGSPITARNQIDETVTFFAWADRAAAPLTMSDVAASYVKWADHLFHRSNVAREISERTAYTSALRVGEVLDIVLGRQKPLLHLTRLTRPRLRKAPLGVEAEKQNLADTFAFGRLLQDVCDGLPLKVVWEVLDVRINRQTGGSLTLWTGGSVPTRQVEWAAWEVRQALARRQDYAANRSLEHRGRKAVVNTRILAELLMFIGQTGMNLTQAYKLKLRHFSYSSDIDGYKVRDYKHRRDGEVLFEIFSEYRSHFERYLEWRRALFPDSVDLFPVIREGSHESRPTRFDLMIGLCKQADVPWIPPSMLRGTRVNWLLRRSGDPDLTADMAQHHKKVLIEVYEQPSLQRTIGEVTRFWQASDPTLARVEPSRSVAPGSCDGVPVATSTKPAAAPSPDCARPSGCLWCEHHRDIDTQDYVWSLACFRHLKVLELGRHCFPATAANREHPAQHAIDKLSEKLTWFKGSNALRRGWVDEALARIEEGSYHSEWKHLILAVEGTAQ
ncbi:site-specific integrase [Caldimonas tepidiphila]|uniref:site-specific integrase n=1 Tax=Caldimonas tepidiphila TaxID=2315841 RepID=UPI000E5C162F|nr:site-specific integrase [Caldimonas tepidiphila]